MPDASVKVVCRFRPENEREKQENLNLKASGSSIDYTSDTTCAIHQPNQPPQVFNFDRIFHSNATQVEVFNSTIKDTIDDVLQGYNGTIFAYGQTGAGKSFSMFGASLQNEETKGIIPRACTHIFNHIAGVTDGTEFTIKCSFLEIYKENVRDLLNPKNSNLKVRETPQRGVWVENLTELFVTCEQDVYDLIQMGEKFRSVSATQMNAVSSRSHSLFILQLAQKSPDGSTKIGKLNLADLAGSEKVGKTGATGELLEEAKKINQSLSALGNCIMSLTKKSGHIPYRDSKLTFILRESLGGNAKTTLLIACSPHMFNIEETVSTLRFGQRAKMIKNNVKVNAQRSVAELEMIISQLSRDMSRLKRYVKHLETALASASGDGFDIEVFRKAFYATIREEHTDEEESSDSITSEEPRTPAKGGSPVAGSSAPSTPTLSRNQIPTSPAVFSPIPARPSLPGISLPEPEWDPTNPSALAEARLAYQQLKEKYDFQIQDLVEELARIKETGFTDTAPKAEEMSEQLGELQQELEHVKYELKQKELELVSSAENLASAKARLDQVLIELKETSERGHRLQASVEVVQSDKAIVQSQYERAQSMIEALRSQLTETEIKYQSSTNEKVAAIELSAIQEEYLATLQKDYDTLKETSDRQNALVLELQTKINLLKQEKDMADALLGTSRQQVQRLESAVASESKSSAENFGRVEASNSQLTELLGQIEKFREDNNLLIRKNTTMESELERLRTEVKSKEALLVTEKAKAQKSVDKVKEAMTMCHESNLAMHSLKLELQMKSKNFELQVLSEQNRRLNAEATLEKMKQNMENKDGQVRSLIDQVSTLKLHLKEEKSQSQLLSQKAIDSAHRIAELEAQLTRVSKRGSMSASAEQEEELLREWNSNKRRGSLHQVTRPIGGMSVAQHILSVQGGGANGAASVEKSAIMTVQDQSGQQWSRRFLIVKDRKLSLYTDKKCTDLVQDMKLGPHCTLTRADALTGKSQCFCLTDQSSNKKLFVIAETEDKYQEWVSFLVGPAVACLLK